MRTQPKALPPKYYLDNFNSLLALVERMYADLLTPSEQAFINRFRGLSEEEKCLFVRFANRRGLFFRTDKLDYPEISGIGEALDELLLQHFCERPSLRHEAFARQFLAVFSKEELIQLYKELKPEQKGVGKCKKPELVELLIKESSWDDLLMGTAAFGPVVKHNFEQELELLKFLFFGYLGGEMSEFVIRDLGHLQYETADEDKLVARFNSRAEIEDKFAVSLAYEEFRKLRELDCPDSLYSWFSDWCGQHPSLCELARPLFNRLSIKLGRILERHQQYQQALSVYQKVDQPPARERRVRLLQKTAALEEAIALCAQMEEEPLNADELFFARDFSRRLRQKKARKSTTLHLKEAETIQISEAWRHQVEEGVRQYYIERGREATYSENYLWRSLFGLLFWDIIFDLEAPVYHSPLQRVPSDLYRPLFPEIRRERMQSRMRSLKSRKKMLEYVEKVYAGKCGLDNPLVSWHENTLPLAQAALQKIKPAQLEMVLLEMAANLKENGKGFPDLFVSFKGGYSFVEVKSPNDSLSARQLFWLRFFKETGIPAGVVRVEWV